MTDRDVWAERPDDVWDPAERPDDGHHGHSHADPASVPPASGRTRRAIVWVLVPAALATLVALLVLWPGGNPRTGKRGDTGARAYGTVTKLVERTCPPIQTPEGPVDPGQATCGEATVRITGGAGPGGTVTVELPTGPGAPSVDLGDELVLLFVTDPNDGATGYTIIDHQRGRPLLWLVALTAAAIIAFGRWRGLSALAGLAVSFAVLLLFVLPAILDGSSPLAVAVVGSAAIAFAVLYLTHGLNVTTSVAILGTLASLLLTGLLGAGFTAFTSLTGLGSEDTMNLSLSGADVDMRGLLLAGIIIGALGVLDDVTVTQAVTVAELSRTEPRRWELYRAALRVGRAHVGSAVNTLVLAYAGASLPVLLLLLDARQDVSDLLTGEFLAQEIVRSAVGTIGLVASVPITTLLAVLVARRGSAGATAAGTEDLQGVADV